ncbi:MAG: TolC family protein [Merismopedia sp. SIO2A8]|nr:TolC family protein [Merismopedia sp. SIO2A8]
MDSIRITMWVIRVLSLILGGGVSVMAIAMLVAAVPNSQFSHSQTTAAFPSEKEEALEERRLRRPHLSQSPSPSDPSELPRVSPLLPSMIPSDSLPLASSESVGTTPGDHQWPTPQLRREATNAGPSDTSWNSQGSDQLSGQNIDESVHEKPSEEEPPVHPPHPSSLTTSTPSTPLALRLQDVVILALEHNRAIKNAYLDRIIQQEVLAVAEDRFHPNVTPRITVAANRNDEGFSTSTQGDLGAGADMDVLFPTGTSLTAGWRTDGDVQGTIGRDRGSSDGIRQSINVEMRHPLLRNSGQTITRAPLQIARLQDEQDVFSLQTTLIDTITAAILQYHALLLAQQQLEIQRQSLERTENELMRIEALIAAGRLAAIERVEAESDVANRQVDVLDAENGLRDAQLNLIQALDIDQTLVPEAVEAAALDAGGIQFAEDDRLVNYALEHNPDYRSSLLDLDVAAIELLQVEDQLQWDLDVLVRYSNDLSSRSAEQSEVRASLELSREFGDRSLKQRVISQRTRIQQLENDRAENRENLEISVRNALREVAFQQTQVEQAERATRLAEQQLESTQIQFRQGSVTFLEVVQSQDNLVNAQNRELSAKINYQNALVALDQELGHTLETWNIQIQPTE